MVMGGVAKFIEIEAWEYEIMKRRMSSPEEFHQFVKEKDGNLERGL